MEARRGAERSGVSPRCSTATRKSDARSSSGRGGDHRGHRERPRLPRALQPSARPQRVRARVEPSDRGRHRASVVRAALRGFARRVGARGLSVRRPRSPHLRGAGRASPGACAPVLGPQRLRATGTRLHPGRADRGSATGRGVPGCRAGARIPLRVLTDTFDEQRRAYGCRFILVRPDQYVAWAGNDPPADTTALLRRVIGDLGEGTLT